MLENKIAIVTGGGSGIGKAIVEKFAMLGAHVHVLDTDESSGNALIEQVNQAGADSSFHLCDVSRGANVRNVAEQIGSEGNIDILVNNAGIAHIGNVETTTEEDMDRLIAVNVKGMFHCMQACIPKMKIQGGGVILNMSSVAATVGISDRFAYSMTKGAVLTMTLSVAKDYVNEKIRCNCISPARVHTPFVDGYIAKTYPGREKEMYDTLSKTQPIGRMAEPEEVAELAAFLCSDKAAFITGTDYPIDGGFIKLNT